MSSRFEETLVGASEQEVEDCEQSKMDYARAAGDVATWLCQTFPAWLLTILGWVSLWVLLWQIGFGVTISSHYPRLIAIGVLASGLIGLTSPPHDMYILTMAAWRNLLLLAVIIYYLINPPYGIRLPVQLQNMVARPAVTKAVWSNRVRIHSRLSAALDEFVSDQDLERLKSQLRSIKWELGGSDQTWRVAPLVIRRSDRIRSDFSRLLRVIESGEKTALTSQISRLMLAIVEDRCIECP
jgi:hypothetical protein